MKTIRILLTIGFTTLLFSAVLAHDKNASLNDEQKAFLSQYESVRAALTADDLAAAKKAAAGILTESKIPSKEPLTTEQTERQVAFIATVRKIATSGSLDTAREGFKQLSKRAIYYAEGKEGYYVAHCPMVANDEGN